MRADIPEIVSRVEWKIDWYDIKTAIEEAFSAELGKNEVVRVDVHQNPYEFGVSVWLTRPADASVKNLARELEKEFRKNDIRVGILIWEAKTGDAQSGKSTSVGVAGNSTQVDSAANED